MENLSLIETLNTILSMLQPGEVFNFSMGNPKLHFKPRLKDNKAQSKDNKSTLSITFEGTVNSSPYMVSDILSPDKLNYEDYIVEHLQKTYNHFRAAVKGPNPNDIFDESNFKFT